MRLVHTSAEANCLTCGACGTKGVVAASNGSVRLGDDFIAKKLGQRGWRVAARARDIRCDACVRSERERKAMTKSTDTPADPPREMTREEGRLIFGKLDGVYVDERRGYENGWSDLRVANDMGVPLAWVRTVRERHFGPEGLNAEAVAVVGDAKALLTKVDDFSVRLKALTDEFAELNDRIPRIARAVEAMEKLTIQQPRGIVQ